MWRWLSILQWALHIWSLFFGRTESKNVHLGLKSCARHYYFLPNHSGQDKTPQRPTVTSYMRRNTYCWTVSVLSTYLLQPSLHPEKVLNKYPVLTHMVLTADIFTSVDILYQERRLRWKKCLQSAPMDRRPYEINTSDYTTKLVVQEHIDQLINQWAGDISPNHFKLLHSSK